MSSFTKKITSPAKMTKLAQALVKQIIKLPQKRRAVVLGLEGDLGAGKTTFAKAFLKELGVREAITSPTFILFRPYPIQYKDFQIAYHIDCYRLEDPRELLRLGLKEMIKNPKHIVIIEWAERVKDLLPKESVWIRVSHGKEKNIRSVSIKGLSL